MSVSDVKLIWRSLRGLASPGHPSGQDLVGAGPLYDFMADLSLADKAKLTRALAVLLSGQPIDDKKPELEALVSMAQTQPPGNALGTDLTNFLITGMWQGLPHPPVTRLGPTARYRSADGAGNNIWYPDLGRAGQPYCRNVPPLRPKGSNLPDPGTVFDALLKREGPFREHPQGLNRLFFSFATIIIHECFQTSYRDPWVNETTSYLDLSTLYGNNQEQQDCVRSHINGLIHPDTIASKKIMMMPPGVITVLLLFSRNHNTIATDLLSINENGKYKDWATMDEKSQKWQDEDIFQLARNINVGYFVTVILKDYVSAILNTLRAKSEWWLNAGDEIKWLGNRLDRGRGNVVSCEFAALYHWHAALSAADEAWMEETIKAKFPDLKDFDDMTPQMFMELAIAHEEAYPDDQRPAWKFNGLERQPDGAFKDADLANVIVSCIESPAHAFGPKSTPHAMKIIEVLGQLQARNDFNLCTLNEFRQYLNLKTYENFQEWAGPGHDDVAKNAELLYGDIDNLELYPGLMAEVTKPPGPASGLCPGQTIGRGILDDAVALIRGDRFLSYDYNSSTLTNWGAAKLKQYAGGSSGGMLPNVIFNALPWSFKGTSTYALYSFYTPKAIKEILEANNAMQQADGSMVLTMYDTTAPQERPIVSIQSQAACKEVFADPETFATKYDYQIRTCTDDHGFILGWDNKQKHDASSMMLYKAFYEDNFDANVSKFFSDNVSKLIEEKSFSFSGKTRTIDIVKQVTNVVPIMWLADRFAIPLKTPDFPHGSPVEMIFMGLIVMALYVGFDIIPANEWILRDGAMQAAKPLREVFALNVATENEGWVEYAVNKVRQAFKFPSAPMHNASTMPSATAKRRMAISPATAWASAPLQP